MLDFMRTASRGLAGRAIMAVVLAVIIMSFAWWGTGNPFEGYGRNNVAVVGGQSISAQAFQQTYQNLLQQYQQQLKAPITNAQAHAMGLDAHVLGQMIADAALDARARSLGLAMSDETIANALRESPEFQDASGRFDRQRFDAILRESGLSEYGFFADRRKRSLRQQIGVSLVGNIAAPKALVEALAHFDGESRAIDYVILPPSAAGDIPAPTPEQLQSFFNERKASFRAPEYRAVNLLSVLPSAIAKPDEVSDADARAEYDRAKEQRFTTPEKRAVQQIVFSKDAEATAALARIKGGASFDEVAKATDSGGKFVDLGETTKADIYDAAVAQAAFALPENGVSDVVKGQFGPGLVHVSKITASSVKPFEEVEAELKKDIATRRAADQALSIHDKIEDARASGKTLTEAAKAAGLDVRAIAAIDARGMDKNGAAVPDIPDKKDVLRAIFASDIGVDDQPVSTPDKGFVWFEVTKIDPPHDRTLDEVKDQVAKQWRDEEVAKALAAKATDMAVKLKGGATLASLAEPDKLEVKNAADIRRSGGAGLAENVVTQIFNEPSDGAGSASVGDSRLVFKITKDTMPPFDPASAETKALQQRANSGLVTDLLSEYVAALERELGVSINQAALQAATGGAS
jgi:peptidyl-prolyl cis-trans isomerase D